MESSSSHSDERAGYGKAVGLSIASAAVIGTAVSAMFGKKESKQDRVRREAEERLAALESTASQSLDQLAKAVQGFRGQAQTKGRKRSTKASKSATKLADQAVAAVGARANELEREARKLRVTESAYGLGNDLSKRASNLTRVLSERGSDLVDEAKGQAPGWKSKAGKSLQDVRARSLTLANTVKDDNAGIGKRAQELASGISDSSSHLLEDAKSQAPAIKKRASKVANEATALGATYAHQAKDRAPEVREQVAHLAEQFKEKAPELQERASQVAAQVGDKAAKATAQARDKAPGLLESAGHQLATILEDAQESAKPHVDGAVEQARHATKRLSSDIIPGVQHQAAHLTEKIDSQAHSATDRIAQTTSVVELKSKQAAVAAGQGGKNLGGLIGWSAAAAGVVYYAFLDESKRAKVRASGGRILSEARSVIRDIRGQDGQFQ
jgi:archaellum component FlaC